MKEEMRCIYCGEEITKEDKVCPNCGTPVESGEKDTGGSDADFNKRIIFAIFIGLVGILSLVLLLTNKKTLPENSELSGSINTSSDETDMIDDSVKDEIESNADDVIQETAEVEEEVVVQEAEEAEAYDAIQETAIEAEAYDEVQEIEEETSTDGAMISNETSGEQSGTTETKEYFIPETALYYNGHHYYLYNDVKSDWSEVIERCEERGGYPAVINDDAENEKLYRYMISMGFDQAFIGLVYDARKGEWSYKVGDDSSYRDWGENSKGVKEPNNANGVEYNVEFDINMHKGYWNDAAYGGVTYTPEGNKYKDRYTYICEWDR